MRTHTRATRARARNILYLIIFKYIARCTGSLTRLRRRVAERPYTIKTGGLGKKRLLHHYAKMLYNEKDPRR